MTVKERAKRRIRKFGKKNKFCYFCAIPITVVTISAINIGILIASNAKKISLSLLSLLILFIFTGNPFTVMAEENLELNLIEKSDISDLSLSDEDEYEDIIPEKDISSLESFDDLKDDDFYDADLLIKDVDKFEDFVGEDSSVIDDNFSKDDWKLILVNKEHFIPEDYVVPLGTISGTMQCDERIIDELLGMLAAAKEDGVDLIVASPYRSTERQNMLFDRDVNTYLNKGYSYLKSYIATSIAVTIPGSSEHQIGLAFDIISPDYKTLTEGFSKTTAGKWLEKNSIEYGFTLRYPKGKEEITGIEFEPWHFRYVGVSAAKFMKDKNICLEELWEDYVK